MTETLRKCSKTIAQPLLIIAFYPPRIRLSVLEKLYKSRFYHKIRTSDLIRSNLLALDIFPPGSNADTEYFIKLFETKHSHVWSLNVTVSFH
jgi:hypothetical protein